MGYLRVKFEEREEISRLLSAGWGIRDVGGRVGRCAGTISREVNRSRKRAVFYRAIASEQDAIRKCARRRAGKSKLRGNALLAKVVQSKLRLFWSPSQRAEYLKRQYDGQMQISAESIYTYIYVLPRGELKKELIKCLRRQHKKRRTQGHSQVGQTANLEDMLSIEERPAEVADRCVPGHWEGDLIIGGRNKSAVGTLVERTNRTVILVPLKNKTAKEVSQAFAKEMKKLPKQMRLTLTYDQGREMALHKLFTQKTKRKVYFAHPRSPWERGTNENTNGLIRQFFPKGTNFNKVSRSEKKKGPASVKWTTA